jgi:hypothetical protein
MEKYIMDTRAFSMARVSRISASAVALAFIIMTSPAFAQENCGSKCGEPRDIRDDRLENQRDPIVTEPTAVEDLVFVTPPAFQLPASNSPVTRESNGQIRSSWAVGVFR